VGVYGESKGLLLKGFVLSIGAANAHTNLH
jgi:hypothetical protein